MFLYPLNIFVVHDHNKSINVTVLFPCASWHDLIFNSFGGIHHDGHT